MYRSNKQNIKINTLTRRANFIFKDLNDERVYY